MASSQDGEISITVSDTEEVKRLTVDPAQRVHEVIAEAFGCQSQQVQRVLFGDMDVLEGESFEDHGIEVTLRRLFHLSLSSPLLASPEHAHVFRHQDGARLSASIKTWKASVAEVAAEILALNTAADGLTVELLLRGAEVDPEDASHVLGDLYWCCKDIVVLPESIGDLTVGGFLELSCNKLESLPESFGSLTVGCDLYLQCNKLESLPESFGSLTVGCDCS